MGHRSATAPRPSDATGTARQIPGYLLFLANWANAVGLVPRRLAGGPGETGTWRAQAGGGFARGRRGAGREPAYLPFAKNATAMPLGPACVPIVAPMETVGNSST